MNFRSALITLALSVISFSSQAAWVYQDGGCTWSAGDGTGQIRITGQGRVAFLYTKQSCRDAGLKTMKTTLNWSGANYPVTQICNGQLSRFAITMPDTQTGNMMLQDMVNHSKVSFVMAGKTYKVSTAGLQQSCRPMFY